ncbi:hypothetical protein SNE40_013406 [Patella caerulea]|uniref:Uncharacterized protein n=1 Tax=Patella caerulea TaxID=87958 RepID=A0AAN8PNH9_PATCE
MACNVLLIRGILTVIGGVFLHVSIGITYIFGNFTPYFTSYLRNRTSSHDVTYADTTWIAMSSGICEITVPLIATIAERRVNYKIIITTACLLASGGVLVTYYTVQRSFLMMILTYGVCFGMGKCMIYISVLKCAIAWFPKKSSIISGIVLGGYGFSAFIFNWIVTFYINPENMPTNLQVGEDWYFTQKKLLDRVPDCFLLLGVIVLGLQIIGLCLLSDAQKYQTEIIEKIYTKTESSQYDSINNTTGIIRTASSEYGSINNTAGIIETDSSQYGSINNTDSINDSQDHAKNSGNREYTVKDILKSKIFYLLFFMLVFYDVAVGMSVTSFKAFGQTFIHDDHFLSLTASMGAFFNSGGRIVWGFISHKIGHTTAISVLAAGFTSTMATLGCTQLLGKYLYLVWVCLIYFFFSGMFAILPAVVLDNYGLTITITAYGMVKSSGVLGAVLTSVLASTLQPILGWKNVFLLSAGLVSIGFVCSLMVDKDTRAAHRRKINNTANKREERGNLYSVLSN